MFFVYFVVIITPGHFTPQPGPGEYPVPVGAARGDAEDSGRLVRGQAGKIAQLNQPGLERLGLGQSGQGDTGCIRWTIARSESQALGGPESPVGGRQSGESEAGESAAGTLH